MSHPGSRDLPMHELAQLIDASDMAMAVGSNGGIITFVNQGFTRLFGYTKEEVVGRKIVDVLTGEHTDRTQLLRVREGLKFRGHTNSEILFYPKTGRPIWTSMVCTPVFDADGRRSSVVAILSDITHSKMHEVLQGHVLNALGRDLPLKEVMDLLCREVERVAPDILTSVIEVDVDGLMHVLAAPSLPPAYSETVEGMAIGPKAATCGTAAWRGMPVTVTDIETDPLWEDFKHLVVPYGLRAGWAGPILSGDGRVLGSFAFHYRDKRMPDSFHLKLADISLYLCTLAMEREETRKRIHQLAYTDALTSLPNRSMTIALAERALEEVRREDNQLAVLFMDMDNFKQINDTKGHAAGDAVLRQMALFLMQVIRKSDIVGRFAGDEFIAVLPRCSAENALSIATRLVEMFLQPLHIDGAAIRCSVSIGAAMFPSDGSDLHTLLSCADAALYQAKHSGRGQVHFFNHDMDRAARERAALEADLREALGRDGELHLNYQPQVDARDELAGMEALLRWNHPDKGLLLPDSFIPVAEECGMIKQVTRWVINEACRQIAAWRTAGLHVPRVAINVSVSDFTDHTLPVYLMQTLQHYGLNPQDVILEITESTMLDDRTSVMTVIESMHALGIRLSLDDFGTGYSSLSYLHRLPISEIKVDKSFVRGIGTSKTAQALIHTMLGIGSNLGLNVVAEGVETPEQRKFLVERGCKVLQGHLFAHPLPPDQIEEWLTGVRFCHDLAG